MLTKLLFLSAVFMVIVVSCAKESDTIAPSYPTYTTVPPKATHTKVPATDIPIPTLTADKTEKGLTCTLTGGEVVKKGWSGKDTGSNSCNQCRCLNPGLACTRMACSSVK
jgi:hypothetical protein